MGARVEREEDQGVFRGGDKVEGCQSGVRRGERDLEMVRRLRGCQSEVRKNKGI